jgi:hypothetical protein
MKSSFKLKLAFAFALALVSATVLYAQPPSPPDQLGPDPIPVDGGLSLLVAAGIGYGAKKLNLKKTKEVTE